MTSHSPQAEPVMQRSARDDGRAERFESHTERLRGEILALSQMVETALLGSVAALQAQVVAADGLIPKKLDSRFYQGVLEFIRDKPRRLIKQVRYLVQIARNLERAADRVTNICEWVIFSLTGQMTPYEPARLEEKEQGVIYATRGV